MARIERDHAPLPASTTNYWLEGEFNFAGAASVWPRGDLSGGRPKIFLTVMGENQKVRSSGRIRFSEAVPMVLDSWNIPTNLIDGDLSSLTAVRGVSHWLSGWNQFETNPPPNQLFVWAVSGVPMETYFAAPYTDASNAVSQLSDFVLGKTGSWTATNELVRFQKTKTFNGLEWKGMPFVFPFFKSGETSGQNFMLGGVFPLTATNQTPPQPLIGEIEGQTNLVYYNWELTGPRLEQLTYITQMLRLFAGRDQLASDSAALQWLNVMNKKLGESATQIIRTSDREFSFTRSSSIGLTAIELQLLAGWLESREFPSGDGFTPRPAHKAGTTSPGYLSDGSGLGLVFSFENAVQVICLDVRRLLLQHGFHQLKGVRDISRSKFLRSRGEDGIIRARRRSRLFGVKNAWHIRNGRRAGEATE